MNRRILALCGLILLVALAGCSFGSNELEGDDLTGDADYQWENNETVTLNLSVSSNSYTTVIHLQNQSELTVYRERAFRGDDSLDVNAVEFRYENGTVVNATQANITAIQRDDETEIRLPAANGSVGFTASRSGKSFSTPVFVEGSYRLDLPEGTRVGIPLISQVDPGGYNTTVENNQMVIRWGNISGGSISIQYYLIRDLYLFGGLILIAGILGVGGIVHYYRQILAAKQKREEVGLDVERDDDDLEDDGPPPGLR